MIFDKSMTQQHFKKQCDINQIVKSAMRAGQLPPVEREGRYEDVSKIPNYQEAMNIVVRANILFDGLPSEIRNRFYNDPGRMIEFIRDPKNVDEAVKLGILVVKEEDKDEKSMVQRKGKSKPEDGNNGKEEDKEVFEENEKKILKKAKEVDLPLKDK